MGAHVRAALAGRSLFGGRYNPVGGTAVATGPVLIVRYESINRNRAVLLVVPRSSKNVMSWRRDLQKGLTTPPQAWGWPGGALVQSVPNIIRTAKNEIRTNQFDQKQPIDSKPWARLYLVLARCTHCYHIRTRRGNESARALKNEAGSSHL